MRILVVEDDADLQRLLKKALTEAGYVVDVASDGEEGHFLGDTEPYDAVVLDLGLPKLDGGVFHRAVLGQRDFQRYRALLVPKLRRHGIKAAAADFRWSGRRAAAGIGTKFSHTVGRSISHGRRDQSRRRGQS